MANGMMRANSKDNSKRRFSGGGPRPDNNELKRTEAVERQEAWSKLAPAQQLEILDRRLGKGVGAAKQRARIQAQLDRASTRPMPAAKAEAPAAEKTKAKDRRAQERTERPTK